MECCNQDCNQGRNCPHRGAISMSEGNRQWTLGVIVGVVATALIAIGAHKINNRTPKENILPSSVIEAYNMGLTDALRTNPVSPQLEQVCVNLWAGRQPYGAR
jgi:hypothetical protein